MRFLIKLPIENNGGTFYIVLTGFRCRGVSREESRKRICNGIKSMYKMLALWYNAVTEKLLKRR